MNYKNKIKNKKHICVKCKNIFYNADVRGKWCIECKENAKCIECNVILSKPNKTLCIKHNSPVKGKTKKEIIKIFPKWNNCGFKKGLENPNYFKKKLTAVSIQNKFNKFGDSFRSSFEVKFSELLRDNNISYQYEKVVDLHNNYGKVIDFIIGDVLIEITGYAYEKWRQNFDKKIKRLKQINNNPLIIIFAYDKFYDEFNERILSLGENNITVIKFSDVNNNFNYFMEKIYFYQNIVNLNKKLNEVENNDLLYM